MLKGAAPGKLSSVSDHQWESGLYTALHHGKLPISCFRQNVYKNNTTTLLNSCILQMGSSISTGKAQAVLGQLTVLCLFAAAANFCEHHRIQ